MSKITGNYLKPPVKEPFIWTLGIASLPQEAPNLTDKENCSDKVSMDRPKTITSPETSIIIVDDTQEYAHILSRILKKGIGYKQVESFSSMDEAYDAISSEPDRFPVVFLDYHFPNGKTGTELLEKLRQNDLLDGRLVFFITAEPAVQKAIEANHNGAVGVIVKPFSTQALQNLIKRVEHTLKLEQLGA